MLKKVKRIKLGIQAYRRLTKLVLERDAWRCQRCGSLKDLQIHHKTKRSHQGHDELSNLITLCAYCHLEEHGRPFYSVQTARQCAESQSHAGSEDPTCHSFGT